MYINEIIKTKEFKKLEKSERAELIKQIYEIYTSPHERILRRKENWKRYISWLKENKVPHTKEKVLEFKKNKKFIKERNVKSICFFLSHIPTKDLYFIISQMKDKKNRGYSASAYLFSSTQWTKSN